MLLDYFVQHVVFFFIHLRSIICSLETKLNCFRASSSQFLQVRRRLLFVTLFAATSPNTIGVTRKNPVGFSLEKQKQSRDDTGDDFVQDFGTFFCAREKGIHIDKCLICCGGDYDIVCLHLRV